jgi:hypothetical protein
MQSVYSSRKIITNVNGKKNYSEEIIQSSNNRGLQTNNIVFRHTAYIEGNPYLVSIQMNDNDIKLILIDLSNGNMIEKIMSKAEIIGFFTNINVTLPELRNELNSVGKKSHKIGLLPKSSEKNSKSKSHKKSGKKSSKRDGEKDKKGISEKKSSKRDGEKDKRGISEKKSGK